MRAICAPTAWYAGKEGQKTYARTVSEGPHRNVKPANLAQAFVEADSLQRSPLASNKPQRRSARSKHSAPLLALRSIHVPLSLTSQARRSTRKPSKFERCFRVTTSEERVSMSARPQ